MTTPTAPQLSEELSGLNASLRRAHRSALVTLALCAVFCALQQWPQEEPPPDRHTTVVAVALALSTIVLRRFSTSPVMGARPRVGVLMASYGAAVALGLTGAYAASMLSAVQTGLVFCVAAAIFCLRPPPLILPPSGLKRPA